MTDGGPLGYEIRGAQKRCHVVVKPSIVLVGSAKGCHWRVSQDPANHDFDLDLDSSAEFSRVSVYRYHQKSGASDVLTGTPWSWCCL